VSTTAAPTEPRDADPYPRDPTPPGKVAIYLFLASEVMFFIGLLGTYIVLRYGAPKLFADQQAALSKPLGGINTIILIASSLTMTMAIRAARDARRKRAIIGLILTLLCAATFLGIKAVEYNNKYHHYTVVAFEGSGENRKAYAYDGRVEVQDANEMTLVGYRVLVNGPSFDVHRISEREMQRLVGNGQGTPAPATYHIEQADISQALWYGPWKNNFFACYYVLTATHAVHILGGMIAMLILLAQAARGRVLRAATEYTGLYWYLVDAVWIFIFVLLYLI
jgi:cytochrome c oxidase subunit 3